jgi:hypothetical protein
MADYYLVEEAKGATWDHSRGRREQVGWDEHADARAWLRIRGSRAC